MPNIDIKELKRIISKTVQAYRIRRKCSIDRIRALAAYKRNSDLKELARALKKILGYEKAILRVIIREETETKTNLDYALEFIKLNHETFKTQLEGATTRDNLTALLKKNRIKEADIIKVFETCILFLEVTRNDLTKIRLRIRIEEKFVNTPNLRLFAPFLKQWKKELKTTNKLEKDASKIVMNADLPRTVKILSRIGMGAVVAAGGMYIGGQEIIAATIAGIGVLSMFASLMGNVEMERDAELLIREMIKTHGPQDHFLRTLLFGSRY